MKIIVSDLDGTLLNKNKISLKNKLAILRWRKKGNLFSMATGRGYEQIKKFIPFANYPIVINNGAAVYDPFLQEIQVIRSIEKKVLKQLDHLFCKDNSLKIIAYGKKKSYLVRREKSNDNRYSICECLESVDDEVLSICIKSENENVLLLYLKFLSVNQELEVSYHNKLIDIVAKGVDKGTTIKKVLSNIEYEKLYLVGNDENDLSMRCCDGKLVAVENAIEEFKKIADIQVRACNNSAISDLVNYILEEDSNGIS